MKIALVVVVAAFALFAACAATDDCSISASGCRETAIIITPTASRLTLAVGDTVTLGVLVKRVDGGAVTPTVHWTPGPPVVVAIDTATSKRAQVRLRAIAAGSSSVTYAVSVDAQVITGSVPVSVTTR